MIPFLESKNVILTPMCLSVVRKGNYISWINNQHSDLFTQHALFPHTLESLDVYAEGKQRSKNNIWLGIICKIDNNHIGNIDVSDIDWINRTGTYNILIGDTKYHGKGIGYEASHLLLSHVFHRLNLNRVQLGVDERNVAARKLYTKLGFKEEGKFEQCICEKNVFFDVIRMRILNSEYLIDKAIL